MINNEDLICQACLSDLDTALVDAPDGLLLRHCAACRLTSVVNPVTTAVYDAAYVAERYDRYATTERMSGLRLAYVETVLKLFDALPRGQTTPLNGFRQVLDVGYGNGSFLRQMTQNGWEAFGHDVNPTEYPGVNQVNLPDPAKTLTRYRAVCFFDALEHFETLAEVRRVSACTDWIFVTAPLPPSGWPMECNLSGLGNWKHWRPGEHHHFFHPRTLNEVFTWEDRVTGVGAVTSLAHVSHFEDVIRGTTPSGWPNTFTAALRCTQIGVVSGA